MGSDGLVSGSVRLMYLSWHEGKGLQCHIWMNWSQSKAVLVTNSSQLALDFSPQNFSPARLW